MVYPNFPEVHNHIQSLDSASTLQAFVDRELELNTGVLTITDHGYMGACSEVYEIAKKNKLIPCIGIEGYVRDDNCPLLAASGINKDTDGTYTTYNKYYHITMHTIDNDAYEQLVRKLSDADLRAEQHGSEKKPLFAWKQLEELGQYNITMMSGCLAGMISRHVISGREDIAQKYYEKLRTIPKPGNFYVEIFPHRCINRWESGVYFYLEDGTKLRYYPKKNIRIESGEFKAYELSKMFAKGANLGKLLAVNHYRKWIDLEPKKIIECKEIQDFIPNDPDPRWPDGDVQIYCNKFVMNLAKKYGDKIVVAGDSHYATADERLVQDSKLMNQPSPWKFEGIYHRMSSDEAFQYFNKYLGMSEEEFRSYVKNNYEFAQKFKNFEFKKRRSLPTKFYPTDTLKYLKELIDKHGRMNWENKEWVDRLKSEIDLLYNNGTIDLLPYFFLAEEVTSLYEQNHMLTGPGRGSAAGLAISYLLGITHVDPLKHGLSRDRFITLDRIQSGKLPDIDIDFSDRDLLLNPKTGWLYKRFGDHVAAISTNTVLRLKSSILDVARAKRGSVPTEIAKLCKELPTPPQGISDDHFVFGYTGDDGKEVKGLIEENEDLQNYIKQYPDEWEIVKKMLGVTRNKSRHACAYAVCNEPLHNFIPLSTISGVRTTQYTAPSVEARGGLKMDFLGLNSLNDLQIAIKLLQNSDSRFPLKEEYIELNHKKVPAFRVIPFNGELYDIWDLPEIQEVFIDISEGKTETVFQLNTSSAKKWLKHFNYWKNDKHKAIDSINAISAFTALDRPGPLDAMIKGYTGKSHNMLIEYANRAKGLPKSDPIEYLDKMIPETQGVIIYQESLEKIYRDLTNCTGIEATNFRTNIGKKQMEKVKAAYPNFMEKASIKVGKENAQKIWDQVYTFGQYGFNFSHAISYSYIAYACAFLKHFYPLQWWCSVLRNADKKEVFEKFWVYCGHLVDLPDIQYSGDTFEIQNNRIRTPLSFLHGIGPGAHSELIAYRPIKDIDDLCKKIALHKKDGIHPIENNKMRMGTSALKKNIICDLIVSDTANSLFPKEMSSIEKMDDYLKKIVQYENEILGTKKKPSKLDEKYINLTALTKYQLCKKILSIYSIDLRNLLYELQYPNIFKVVDKNYDYTYKSVPFVNGEQLKYLNSEIEIQEDTNIDAICVGYILEAKKFGYGNNLQAYKVFIEVDGKTFEFVKWPHRKTKILDCPQVDTDGSLAILTVSRWNSKKPFNIEDIKIIQAPLSKVKKEESVE